MKRHFCNLFTAIISILYIIHSIPILFSAIYSENIVYILQEILFLTPYCIGNFIIATLLIYSSLKNPVDADTSFKSLLISFLGTNLYVMLSWFIEFKNPNANLTILYIATILQVLVQCFYLFALINLGRSLTVLPEARELKTKGIYSISRHPLYVSYMVINVLNLFTNQSLIYVPIMFICNFLQYNRAKAEEKILTSVFPEYLDYKKDVMFLGKKSWFTNKRTA